MEGTKVLIGRFRIIRESEVVVTPYTVLFLGMKCGELLNFRLATKKPLSRPYQKDLNQSLDTGSGGWG